MMIVMTPQASDEQIGAVKARLEALGSLHVLVMPGELTTAIGAIGDPSGVAAPMDFSMAVVSSSRYSTTLLASKQWPMA